MFKKCWRAFTLACLLLFLTVSMPLQAAHMADTVRMHSTVATCSGNSCDGQDPVASGCSRGASQLGRINGTWEDQNNYDHNHVMFSNACQSNYGYVSSVNGQPLVLVAIFRADQPGKFCNSGGCTVNGHACAGSIGCDFPDQDLGRNNGNARFYCSQGGPACMNTMPAGATTWETDLLYSPTLAPNQEIQICQLPAGSVQFYCSAWH